MSLPLVFRSDARIVRAFGEKLKNLQEHERPQRVIFAVVTDGADNFSREFSLADVWTRIARQSYAYSWEFVYLAKKANDLREHCELTEKTLSRPEETAEEKKETKPIVNASIDEQQTEQPIRQQTNNRPNNRPDSRPDTNNNVKNELNNEVKNDSKNEKLPAAQRDFCGEVKYEE